MMKYVSRYIEVQIFLLVQCFCLMNFSFNAQINLVPNPSFEEYNSCPVGPAEILKANGWQHNGSSDYFNVCAPSNQASVPYNWGGYQIPASGNAYAAIITYYSQSNNTHELLSNNLSSTLVIGTKYFVSFKANLSLGYVENANCATNKLGAMFSTKPISGFNAIITNNPPIYSNSIITDTLGWTKIFGSFTSDSAYTSIIIGNFFDDNNTTITPFFSAPVNHAYYFIDDICVSTDSSYALNYVTDIPILESPRSYCGIYPNPAIEDLTLYGYNNQSIYRIFNTIGAKVKEGEILSNRFNINVADLNQGLYSIQINNQSYKFIKYNK